VPPGKDGAKMLDDIFADHPTDAGATITTRGGRLSRGALQRLRILDGFAEDFSLTHRIGQALADLNLFEPCPLKFDVAGRIVEVSNLFIVGQDAFETGKLSPVLEELVAPAALVLGLHRISVFRTGMLLAMARKLLNPPPSDSSDDSDD